MTNYQKFGSRQNWPKKIFFLNFGSKNCLRVIGEGVLYTAKYSILKFD